MVAAPIVKVFVAIVNAVAAEEAAFVNPSDVAATVAVTVYDPALVGAVEDGPYVVPPVPE
jgi:hypothetical protein